MKLVKNPALLYEPENMVCSLSTSISNRKKSVPEIWISLLISANGLDVIEKVATQRAVAVGKPNKKGRMALPPELRGFKRRGTNII